MVATAAASAAAVAANVATYSCTGTTILFNCCLISSSTLFAVQVLSAAVRFFVLSRSASAKKTLHLDHV